MRPLPNFDFTQITSYTIALTQIEAQINTLREIVDECDEYFTEDDRKQLKTNILWLKRFYEAAERCLLDDN